MHDIFFIFFEIQPKIGKKFLWARVHESVDDKTVSLSYLSKADRKENSGDVALICFIS